MASSKPRRSASSQPARRGSASARSKAAAFRKAEAARHRRRRLLRWTGLAGAALLIIAVIVIAVVASGHHPSSPTASAGDSARDSAMAPLSGPPGPEGIVLEQGSLLAPARGSATGQTVDGVQCNSMEQAVYHIHTHLTIYVNGALRPVPPGIGVVEPVAQRSGNGVFDQASRCYYWLHTHAQDGIIHAQDGIIHVEAPSHATYTLGQFFAIWRQRLSRTQIGPAHGTATTYVNGTRYPGDPATITLTSHKDIQLDVGTPTVAPQRIDWSHAQL